MGPICSTCVHSQIHLHYMCKIYSQSVQPFDHISQAFELLTPVNLPQCRRAVSWDNFFLAYVHSQMNPQTCTEFSANRSIRLAAFPDLNLWSPETPRNAPCGIEGWIVFSYVHSQTNLQTCTKCGANRSNSLTASPDIWICDPLKPPEMPPGVLWGELYLAYVHSQMNPQTWTKVGAKRTASQYFWIVDPLKPPKFPPCVWRGNLFGIYPFPYKFAHVCQIWCQSAQPFGSFSRIYAKVSFGFSPPHARTPAKTRQKTKFIHQKL